MSGASSLAFLPLPEVDLERAGRILGARCGLRFAAATRDVLDEGLQRAAGAQGIAVAALLQRLEAADDEALLQSVIRHVTIGETYFFRHPEHFDVLREQILPELVAARAHTRVLRAWSAGCASGEEAYSLAIALKGAAPGYNIRVLGSDINRAALETARAGRYGRWSLRGPRQSLSAQLLETPDGFAQVSPEIRALVHFQYLNLRDPIYPSLLTATHGLDVIFCRNVLVYFFPDVARAVLARLQGCLVDGGCLVVSALDLDLAPKELLVRHFGSVTLLQKSSSAQQVVAPQQKSPASRTTPQRLPPPMSAEAWEAHRAAKRALAIAKLAADGGDLDAAVASLREAVTYERLPETLHLLALVLSERGDQGETLALLAEVVARAPDYVMGHLSYGLADGADARGRRARHLGRVLQLIGARRDEEVLPGPDPLPVSWVRKMANAGLNQAEGGR